VALSVLGAVTLTLGGAFGAARPVAARTTAVIARGAGISSSVAVAAPAAAGTAPHIMLIVEENEGYKDIIGSSSAPYLNTLAKSYVSATNWYAVQHNSPHDYLDLTIGSDLGLPNGVPYSMPMLVDELHSAGVSWKGYMESMPSNCANGSTSNGLYDPNHNPFHYFSKYSAASGGWCNSANLGTEGVLPYPGSSGLVTALDAANAPDFVFLVPNDCDNMHGDSPNAASPCNNSSNAQLIKTGDTWLSNSLPGVLNSSWFNQDGIVIITWDEGSDSSGCCGLASPGGHVSTIVMTPGNQGAGAFTTTGDHYGTLRAIEEAYGVGFLGGSAKTTNGDLTGAFGKGKPVTGSISGTVSDAQTAAAIVGATVTCTCSTTGAVTGAGGSYSFASVNPGGGYALVFSDAGHVSQTVNNVTVTAGKTITENAALVEDASIAGKVTDATTHLPIANATVTCTCQSGSLLTNSGGNYTFANVAPAGNYSLTFSAAGYTSQNINNVGVTAGHATTENVALGQPTGGIMGTVTDGTASGDPTLTGVSVTCTCQSGGVTTNSAGVYSFASVAPGSYALTFSDSGFVTQTMTGISVSSGVTTTANAAMVEDGAIQGQVTDAQNGDPIVAATVTCAGCPVTSATTDSSGDYIFNSVPNGSSYSLTFAASGYATQTMSNVTVTGPGTTTESIGLNEDGGISGMVTDAQTSLPLQGVTVTCSGGCSATTSTDSFGNYSFEDVAPGTYSLTFSDGGFVTQTVSSIVVASGSPTLVTAVALTEDGEITGTVTDQQSTAPISGATVTCGGGCPTTTATTDNSGNFAFTDVPNGATYSIIISAAGHVTQTITGVTVTGPNDTSESTALTEDGGVSGTVVAAGSLTPIQNAMVTCTCRTGSVTTDSSGAYEFTQVAPGASYTVSATAPGFTGQTSSPFGVTPGVTSTVNLQLAPIPTGLKVVETFGAANGGATGTASLTATTGTATGAGDLLVVTVRDRGSPLTAVSGISDSASGLNTWQKATGIQNGSGDEEIWYASNASSVTSITLNVTGTASLAMTVLDISGATSAPLDAIATKRGSGTAATTGTTATTGQANEIVIADVGWNSALTPSKQTAGFTVVASQQSTVSSTQTGEQAAWRVLTATGAETFAATLSSSVPWLGAIATFG
jgi:Carboxypeptidase regulatory-like domain/Phosphoesterase family